MRSFNLFLENNWMSTYTYSDQIWLSDSLNWEKTSVLATFDWSMFSFIFQSSFLSNVMFNDFIVKLSTLDTMLIQLNTQIRTPQFLYDSFIYDIVLFLNIYYLPFSTLILSSYQEHISSVLILAPELSFLFTEYVNNYVLFNLINTSPSAVFDSYLNNLNFFYGEGCVQLFLFFLYVYFIVYIFTTVFLLKWGSFFTTHFWRFYYYFYSLSKETRIQFEAVTQTMIFLLVYWGMVLMAFDDDQEEVIEFVDTFFFNFITIIIVYMLYRYSIHYFSFLEASISEGKAVKYIVQAGKDTINSGSIFLRFYLLALRINIYDLLDDVMDSYYCLLIDFDDDEYFSELLLSIHGTLFFSNDNHDDRSFLLEDENGFMGDFFYLYFLIFGKIVFFLVFMIEEAGKVFLGFFISFLIIFEMHSVNCSYREDLYINTKKQ